MEKLKLFLKQKGNYLLIGVVLFFSLLVVFVLTSSSHSVSSNPPPRVTPTIKTQTQAFVFTYNGQKGKDALTLLKAQATIEQDKSGLVTSINNRKADDAKHEYWSFYVNGKLASVGPADYQTKDTDKIEWKIEKY